MCVSVYQKPSNWGSHEFGALLIGLACVWIWVLVKLVRSAGLRAIDVVGVDVLALLVSLKGFGIWDGRHVAFVADGRKHERLRGHRQKR